MRCASCERPSGLTEEALESVHKQLRYLRAHHSRTTSRKDGLNDIFNGLLVASDPVIASLRKKPKPKGQIGSEVLKMLFSTKSCGTNTTNLPCLVESDDDEDVDDRSVSAPHILLISILTDFAPNCNVLTRYLSFNFQWSLG